MKIQYLIAIISLIIYQGFHALPEKTIKIDNQEKETFEYVIRDSIPSGGKNIANGNIVYGSNDVTIPKTIGFPVLKITNNDKTEQAGVMFEKEKDLIDKILRRKNIIITKLVIE